MKGLWLGKDPPRGQGSHVPSGLCLGLSLFFRRLSEIRLLGRDVRSLSRVRLFATPWTVAYQAPSMGFSREEYWSGLPFPSPGVFPTQGSNLGLPHCRQTIYCLSHQGSWELHLISQHPRAFPSVVGGSNCQKETPPTTNAVFMEIAEDKAILAWTLMGATGRKSPMVLRQKVSCLWLVVSDKLKDLPKAWL